MPAKFKSSDFDVIYEGKIITQLNPRLAAKQNLSRANLEALKETHIFKHMLFNSAKATDDPATLKALATLFERVEFEQQRLWGFPQDSKMHRWFDFPKCACPKMDNQDRYGTGFAIINSACPIHGTAPSPAP